MFGTVVASWLIADFISGFFHWVEDRYLTEDMPIIGKIIAEPNIRHHTAPLDFLQGNYFVRNWTAAPPALLVMGITLLFTREPIYWLPWLFVSQSNEIHCWAHAKGKVSKWIERLQETGILQSPKHHGVHHVNPYVRYYCVMTNFLNPILDELRFWRMLELGLATFGIRPKR